MKYSYKITSSVVGPRVNVRRKDASAFAQALRQARTSTSYKKTILGLLKDIEKKINSAVISAFGGGTLSVGKPVATPVFTTTLDITTDPSTEKITSLNRSIVSRVSISNPIPISNIETESGDEFRYNQELVDYIRSNKNNSAALYTYLSQNKLTKRLVTNFNDIGIEYRRGSRTMYKKISFKDYEVMRAISSGKAKIKVEEYATSIGIYIYFSESTMASAISAANAKMQQELTGTTGQKIIQIIAEETALPSDSVMRDVKGFLESLGISYMLKYINKGTLNRTNVLLNTIADARPNYQSFLSSIQWTALVQARLGDTMERTGEPEPPDLKERTGRFRSSVSITANYRKNLIYYTYLPLYSSLERYGYMPNLQVETAIREVAQRQFADEFRFTAIKGPR